MRVPLLRILGKKRMFYGGGFIKNMDGTMVVFTDKRQILKLKYDWFVIIRNPYERLISEFYCKWGGIGKLDNISHIDEKKFNLYIKRRLLLPPPKWKRGVIILINIDIMKKTQI